MAPIPTERHPREGFCVDIGCGRITACIAKDKSQSCLAGPDHANNCTYRKEAGVA
jgi:hypothetical protein